MSISLAAVLWLQQGLSTTTVREHPPKPHRKGAAVQTHPAVGRVVTGCFTIGLSKMTTSE